MIICTIIQNNQKNMKEAANSTLSVHLLIMTDTLFLRPSLHFTTLHYPLIWLNPISISYRSISLHITTLHLTSLHCTFRLFSPHFCSFHFTPFITVFLTLFLKLIGLQLEVPNVSAASWFQFLMVWNCCT